MLGFTGTGGSGKSSVVDELVRRFHVEFPDKHVLIVGGGDSAIEAAIATCEKELGEIAGLVNNAGWDRAAPFIETDAEFWREEANRSGHAITILAWWELGR